MTIADTRQGIIDRLAAIGQVDSDPRNFTPPGVLVDMPTSIAPVGKAAFTADHMVIVVAANGNGDSARWLLDAVEAVIDEYAGNRLLVASGTFDWQGNQLPCYRIQISLTTTRANC